MSKFKLEIGKSNEFKKPKMMPLAKETIIKSLIDLEDKAQELQESQEIRDSQEKIKEILNECDGYLKYAIAELTKNKNPGYFQLLIKN